MAAPFAEGSATFGVRESDVQVARLEQAPPGEGSGESEAHASPILNTVTAPNTAPHCAHS